MLPDKSTPPQAETDLPLGRARIPANWSLQLVLYVATCVFVQCAASGHPFVHTVDSASSVEAEDLFNNMHHIVITNLVDR